MTSLRSTNGNAVNGIHSSEPTAEKAKPADSMAFKLGNFSIDEARPMKVIIIGAGYSGITAGIRFRQRVTNLDITIYESNAGVGGTWFANRYPGLACDVPSHSYQLTFEDNVNWSAFYAPGPEIRAYLDGVADKYKLRPYIKLQHRVVKAEWNESTGKWHVRVRRRPQKDGQVKQDSVYGWDWKNDYEEIEDTADVLFTGLGPLSRWTWPEIEGLESFKGKVLHSAQWETGEAKQGETEWETSVKDWKDKNVAVIGVGSSAIQMVPALQPKVKHLVNYVRGKTWISASFVKDMLLKLSKGEDVPNYTFTEDDKNAFADTEYYRRFRYDMEADLNGAHSVTIRGSEFSVGANIAFKEDMLKRLSKKAWIANHILPDFVVGCRRITPGPGYLEALCEDNVDFVPSKIKKVTPNGIETEDGKFQELDVIICATGFDTSYKLDFPIIGRGGIDLNKKYTPHPRTYLAVAVDGFPNMFLSLGPNAAVGAGSLLVVMEKQVDYAVLATLKLQRERLKSMDVKPETVFSEKCRSWYKAGKDEGRVVALWPGSSLHAARALTHPRWEDYNFERLDKCKNRFYWLGDGHTVADRDPQKDRAYYMNEIDYPPVPL